MIKNSRLTMIIMVPAVLIFVALFIASIYSIRGKSKEASKLLNTSREAETIEVRAKAVRALRSELTEEFEIFKELVLSEDKIVDLIEIIEGAGVSLGVETKVISVAKVDAKNQSPKVIKMIVETNGSWPLTLAMSQALESLPYKVTVEEVSINKDGGEWSSRTALLLNYFK